MRAVRLQLLPDPEGRLPPWLGDLSQLPRPQKRWTRVPGNWKAYVCADYPGVAIAHCGHPTAHRPYYFIGLATPRKVRLLDDAKACVEAVFNGLVGVGNL